MRILLRKKIRFFRHLTVSWALPVVTIIFLKRCYVCNYFMRFRRRVPSQIQSGGFTNLLCKGVKCHEGKNKRKNKISFAEEAIGNIIKSNYMVYCRFGLTS